MESFKLSCNDFVFESAQNLRRTYQLGRSLGEGSFGRVRRATHKESGDERAIKVIDKKMLNSSTDLESFLNEVSMLKSLDHPNIVKVFEYYQDSRNYYLITELCSGGELFERIISRGSFNEAQAAHYMKAILSVIAYCHERNIVHCDLKPENFLFDSENSEVLKAIDFGAAQFFREQPLDKIVGTVYYIAPEVIEKNYTEKCDVWSAGVIMYILLCGSPPFGGENDDEILENIREGTLEFSSPDWDSVSAEAKHLIGQMLNREPQERISAKEALRHPWMLNARSEPLNSRASEYLSNLKNLKSEQVLKKATLAYISSHLLVKHEKEDLMSLFCSLDKDNSGTLSRDELMEGFQTIYEMKAEDTELEVDKILEEVDTDKSGEIDYSEFVAAATNKQTLLTKENIEAAFKLFDADNSGTITAAELKATLGRNNTFNEGIWSQIISEVDQNQDGVIDFNEFTDMMLSKIY